MIGTVENKLCSTGYRAEFAYNQTVMVYRIVVQHVILLKITRVIHEIIVNGEISDLNIRAGYDAVIMAGGTVGDGAIIGTRAVVKKDVEPYSIVGGIPAKEIRKRFSPDIVARLQKLQWWNWDIEKIRNSISAIKAGDIDALENQSL